MGVQINRKAFKLEKIWIPVTGGWLLAQAHITGYLSF